MMGLEIVTLLAAALAVTSADNYGIIDGGKAEKGEVPWIVSLRSFSVIGKEALFRLTHFMKSY